MAMPEAIFNAADKSGSGSVSPDTILAVWKSFDKSGSGKLSEKDFITGLKGIGFDNEERAKLVFSKLDKKGEGSLSEGQLQVMSNFGEKGGKISKQDYIDAAKAAVQ